MVVSSLLIGLLLTPAAGPEISSADLQSRADAAFREAVRLRETPLVARRLFRQAARDYGDLQQRGLRSAALCRNQGNASLLADDLPQALLAYRRGLRLAVNNRDLQMNLAYARGLVEYPAGSKLGRQPVDHWPPWLPRPTRGLMLVLTLVLYSLGCLALVRWGMTRHGSWLWMAGIAFTTALLPAAVWGALEWQHDQETRHPLVVIARDGVYLHKGNGPDYPHSQESPLPRGVEARQRFARGDWLQIELAGGEVGWVPRSVVLVDEQP